MNQYIPSMFAVQPAQINLTIKFATVIAVILTFAGSGIVDSALIRANPASAFTTEAPGFATSNHYKKSIPTAPPTSTSTLSSTSTSISTSTSTHDAPEIPHSPAASSPTPDRYTGGPISPLQAAFDVHYYDINLRVALDRRMISGHTDLYIIPEVNDLLEIEIDLASEFRISYVSAGGKIVTHRREGDKLIAELASAPAKGESFRVRVVYSGSPQVAVRPPWDGGFNWSEAPDGTHWVGVTCQGEGAKIWYPAVDHPSRRPDSASVNITVPVSYVAAANGLLQSLEDHGTGFHTYRWKTRYPIHTYNINFSIAQYRQFEKPYTLKDGSEMPVIFYVLPDDYNRAEELVDMAIEKLGRLRKYYGEYPFQEEKFGIVQTAYLGMEHQTINAYGNNFRYTHINDEAYDWLLLHEMGHEWWGNKITVTDWADFWIHEGITAFTDALYLWDRFGEEHYHENFASRRRSIRNEQPVIPGSKVNSKEVYTLDVYNKGAYFMHSLRFFLGDDQFFPILKEFATDKERTYDNFTSTDDFMRFFEERTGEDLEEFFHLYLYTTDLPEIVIQDDGEEGYLISIPNISFEMPMEIKSVEEIKRYRLGPEPVRIRSVERPVVDPMHWYLKK